MKICKSYKTYDTRTDEGVKTEDVLRAARILNHDVLKGYTEDEVALAIANLINPPPPV